MKLKTCFRLRAIACAALLLTACPALTAQAGNVLSIGEIAPLRIKAGQDTQQKLTLQIRPGFHVNSNKPNDEFLIPLKLTWTGSAAVEAGTVEYPAPKVEKSDFSEKPLSVFDGSFQIVTRFRAAPNAAAAAGVLNGKLRYQACNNRECLQPKTIAVQVPYEIEN